MDSQDPDNGGRTPPVFICEGGPLVGLGPGATFELTGSEGKHALVQRLQPGEVADIVAGNGLRLRCVMQEIIPGVVKFEVSEVIQEPKPAVTITLVQALAKGDRDELAIETAVEVGVGAIVPWQADRSIVQWRADKAIKAKAKWKDSVRAATKQARRAYLPPVFDVLNSKRLANQIASIVSDGGAVWVLDAAASQTVSAATLPGAGELLIIVGPEGGISPAESAAFQKAGAELVKLGPHIMRTSTAGPIAVARAAERLGYW